MCMHTYLIRHTTSRKKTPVNHEVTQQWFGIPKTHHFSSIKTIGIRILQPAISCNDQNVRLEE